MIKPGAKNPVSDYIAGLDAKDGIFFQDLYKIVKQIIPDIKEGVSYAMPAFIYKDKPLLCFALTNTHYGIYPMGSQIIDTMKNDLVGLDTTKGSIHFPLNKPLPKELIKKMVNKRLEQINKKLMKTK